MESLKVVWRVRDKKVGGILRCKMEENALFLQLHPTANTEYRPTAMMMEGVALMRIWSTNEQVKKQVLEKLVCYLKSTNVLSIILYPTL